MNLIHSLSQSVQDRKLRKRLKMQKREAVFTVISIISAVLFVIGMVIGIVNIVESIKKRLFESKKKAEPSAVYNKEIVFVEEKAEAYDDGAEQNETPKEKRTRIIDRFKTNK